MMRLELQRVAPLKNIQASQKITASPASSAAEPSAPAAIALVSRNKKRNTRQEIR